MEVKTNGFLNREIIIILNDDEATAILCSLQRTMCKGDDLTISMELEDKLAEIIKIKS